MQKVESAIQINHQRTVTSNHSNIDIQILDCIIDFVIDKKIFSIGDTEDSRNWYRQIDIVNHLKLDDELGWITTRNIGSPLDRLNLTRLHKEKGMCVYVGRSILINLCKRFGLDYARLMIQSSLSLSSSASYIEQKIASQTNYTDESDVKIDSEVSKLTVLEGLDFILSHFEEPLWPRTVSTKQTQNRQVLIYSKQEALDYFATSDYVDCRIAGFVFGLSQLKLFTLKMPSYSGTPRFIQNRSEYAKSYLMGILLGNAGVGCPNPMFYWLLIYIAGTGSLEIGSSLGLVHGVGRAIPLILFSLLAVLGVNATKGLTTNRIKVEKITGWMLVVIGAFLIINGLPGGHAWYEGTIVHLGWNNLISMAGLPVEFHIGQHAHQNPYNFTIPNDFVPTIFLGLIIFPIIGYFINQKKVKMIL